MGASLSNIDQDDYPLPDDQGVATQLNANYTLVPEILGWQLEVLLAGVVLAWYPIYVVSAKRRGDRLKMRVIGGIASALAVAAGLTGMIAIIWHAADQDRSNDEISKVIPPDSITSTLASLVAALVQCFFATRCFSTLPKRFRWVFAAIVLLLALTGLAGGIGFSVVCLVNNGNTDESRGAAPDTADQLFVLAQIWLWGDALADIFISSLLCWRLLSLRDRGEAYGVSSMDAKKISPVYSWVGQLCRLTLGTALVTSTAATAAAITFITTYQTTNLALVFTNLLPGLYALSCLWVLTARHRFLDETSGSTEEQIVWDIKDGTSPRFNIRLTGNGQIGTQKGTIQVGMSRMSMGEMSRRSMGETSHQTSNLVELDA